MPTSLRRNVKAAYTIWYRDVLRFFKDPMRMVASLGQPLLFLFVFGAGLAAAVGGLGGGRVDYKVFMFPGIIAMTVLFTAVFSAMSVVWDREFGFLREVMVAPVSRVAVSLGKVAGGGTVAVFQGVIILLLAPLIGVRFSLLQVIEILALMVLIAAVMSAFGILLAARQRTMEGFQVIMQFILLPMFFLSGAFFPLTQAPPWLSAIAKIDPVTYGVDALRHVTLSETVPPVVLNQLTINSLIVDVILLVVLFVAFLVPAVYLFGKQD